MHDPAGAGSLPVGPIRRLGVTLTVRVADAAVLVVVNDVIGHCRPSSKRGVDQLSLAIMGPNLGAKPLPLWGTHSTPAWSPILIGDGDGGSVPAESEEPGQIGDGDGGSVPADSGQIGDGDGGASPPPGKSGTDAPSPSPDKSGTGTGTGGRPRPRPNRGPSPGRSPIVGVCRAAAL